MSKEKDYINALPHPILPVTKHWDREDGYYYLDAENRNVSPEQILAALNANSPEVASLLNACRVAKQAILLHGDAPQYGGTIKTLTEAIEQYEPQGER